MKKDISLFLAVEKLVQEKMFLLQGMHVIKDIDLSEIFEVNINEFRRKISKNMDRFPSDFMITIKDKDEIRYVFAESGIIMLGGILESDRAIKVHMQFIEYFVDLANENGISIFDLLMNNKNEL